MFGQNSARLILPCLHNAFSEFMPWAELSSPCTGYMCHFQAFIVQSFLICELLVINIVVLVTLSEVLCAINLYLGTREVVQGREGGRPGGPLSPGRVKWVSPAQRS